MEDSPAQVSVNPSPEQEKISDINIQANPGAEPYAFLGLPEGSELEDIKNKVRKLRGRFHPDRVTSDEEKVKTGSILADINVAYKTILAALDVSFSNRGGINKEAIEINEAIEVERFRVRVEEGIKIKLAILENSLNSIEDLTLMSTEYFLATFNIGADMYFKKTGVNLLYPYFTEVLNFYRRAIDMVFSEEFIKKKEYLGSY
jgi:hypothetical protein